MNTTPYCNIHVSQFLVLPVISFVNFIISDSVPPDCFDMAANLSSLQAFAFTYQEGEYEYHPQLC